MIDPLTKEQRSAHMRRIRGTGAKGTELKVRMALVSRGLRDWKLNLTKVKGRPDFYFPQARLAVFVDGCFWHGCQKCKRNLPKTNTKFWREKISRNRLRDKQVNYELKLDGIASLRVWEHTIRNDFPKAIRLIVTEVERRTNLEDRAVCTTSI